MKMVVGLGNPGDIYKNTRHNIGFSIIDNYVLNKNIKFHEKFNGLYTKINNGKETFILLKPLSFMNLSGTVVKKYVDYFKIKIEDILIIQDDLDLPLGKIKIKSKGSSGGHNGIRNIIDELKCETFARFKIGIGRDDSYSIKDYVLTEFTTKDKTILSHVFNYSNDIIDYFINNNIEKVMSKYNGVSNEFE